MPLCRAPKKIQLFSNSTALQYRNSSSRCCCCRCCCNVIYIIVLGLVVVVVVVVVMFVVIAVGLVVMGVVVAVDPCLPVSASAKILVGSPPNCWSGDVFLVDLAREGRWSEEMESGDGEQGSKTVSPQSLLERYTKLGTRKEFQISVPFLCPPTCRCPNLRR